MTDVLDLFPTRVSPEPNSGCWLWTGAEDGYPLIRRRGLRTSVHRLSYALSRGAIPAGLHVMHKCDTKLCVNPAHLEAGTNAQNVRDAYSRGLTIARSGAGCPHAKLTPEQVAEIRAVRGRFRRGQQSEMAARFGVATTTIRAVRMGRTWGRA